MLVTLWVGAISTCVQTSRGERTGAGVTAGLWPSSGRGCAAVRAHRQQRRERVVEGPADGVVHRLQRGLLEGVAAELLPQGACQTGLGGGGAYSAGPLPAYPSVWATCGAGPLFASLPGSTSTLSKWQAEAQCLQRIAHVACLQALQVCGALVGDRRLALRVAAQLEASTAAAGLPPGAAAASAAPRRRPRGPSRGRGILKVLVQQRLKGLLLP